MELSRATETIPLNRTGRSQADAAWLVRLRWLAVCGQLTTIAVVAGVLRVSLPLVPLLTIIGFTAITNVGFHGWVQAPPSDTRLPSASQQFPVAVVMTLDLVLLTALLYFSGGPANPFATFYLVNVALAALLLPNYWSWLLTIGACLGYAALFFNHVELTELREPVAMAPLASPLLGSLGLFVAVSASAGVVVYFVSRVTQELQNRELQLRDAEQQRARAERLEALSTLAAGAGHELATPLSTIAVVVKELSRHLEGQQVPQSVLDDVALIRQELDQCRTILTRLSGSAGQAAAEEVVRLNVAELLDEILEGVHRRARVQLEVSERDAERLVRLPQQAVAQAVRGVVRNGLDASPAGQSVTLAAECREEWLRLTIRDRGTGMSPDVAARALDPFFTTKEPGRGLGLGLFLTKSVVDRLGGSLELESRREQGTTVTIALPVVSRGEPFTP